MKLSNVACVVVECSGIPENHTRTLHVVGTTIDAAKAYIKRTWTEAVMDSKGNYVVEDTIWIETELVPVINR